MGVKGRDLLFWPYIAFGLVTVVLSLEGYKIVSLLTLTIMLLFLIPLAGFYYRVRLAKRKSKELGLKVILLLPVSKGYIKWLFKHSQDTLDKPFEQAFEIHVNTQKKLDTRDFTRMLREDLKYLQDNLTCTLLIWETNVPIPQYFRQLIKWAEVQGLAFWKRGRWPIMVPPVSKSRKTKYTRHGAFILNEHSKGGLPI